MNGFFVALVLVSVLLAAFTGRMEVLTRGTLESAGKAAELALGLVGALSLFLGLMRVASDAGLLRQVARAAAPLLRRLFPGVPADHPAMSAIVLNIAANFLGLGNAATPFGLKAMAELDRLNPEKGTATDAMVTFLAINVSGLALIPTSVVALRAASGSKDPAGILVATWFAGACAAAAAVGTAFALARAPRFRAPSGPAPPQESPAGQAVVAVDPEPRPAKGWAIAAAVLYALALAGAVAWRLRGDGGVREITSFWILPSLVAGIVLVGWARGVKVYASLVEGAKEGFHVAIRVLPYLVAIVTAVGMFRASGAMDSLVAALEPVTGAFGLPAEALPLVALRPLSGSGSFAVLGEILARRGPDSYVGYVASALQGSTETTFYVLAVYFGAVGIRRTRHAIAACLIGDAVGMAAAVAAVRLLLG